LNFFGGFMMKKKRETFEHLHKKPVTRRDFLSSGLLSFSTTMFMPSMLNVFARSGVSEAEDLLCKAVGANSNCTFVGIKLSGGAALSANFVPHGADHELVAEYTKVGLGTKGNLIDKLDYEFANSAPFYNLSGVLTGIRANTTAVTRGLTNFIGVPVRSQDDSAMNKFDITGLVAASGLNGKILPNMGTADTPTGVRIQPAYLAPSAPLITSSMQDVVGALGVSQSLGTDALNDAQRAKLFKTVQELSASQASKIQGMSGGALMTQLLACANIDNSNLIANASSLNIDPIGNAAFSTIWGLTAATSKSSQDYVFATLVYNALNGNAGAVNLEMGGFDYHNNTRTSGDGRDEEAGIVIGKVLQSMALMLPPGKKGFIVVTSDGSVTSGSESAEPGAVWTSDRGAGGSAYMLAFDPSGSTKVRDWVVGKPEFQLGHFTKDQVADETFITGGNPEIAGGGMFINYLAFNGQVGTIDRYLPRVFSATDIDKIVMFNK
jgi:hypothetical protein